MVKETEKFDRERRVWSTCFAHFWSAPEGDIGCLSALAGRYNAWQVSAISRMRSPWNCRAGPLASRRACHSFTQAHRRVSKVQQKTCLLGEERTRAPSILTLSWRIPIESPKWKVVAEPWKDAGFVGLRRRRIQSGARDEAWSLRAFV